MATVDDDKDGQSSTEQRKRRTDQEIGLRHTECAYTNIRDETNNAKVNKHDKILEQNDTTGIDQNI